MGGSSTKIKYNPFECINNTTHKVSDKPLKFNTLTNVRCIFFTQDIYNDGNHIPKETLTLKFESSFLTLENDIDEKIKETYNNINSITPNNIGIKILSPIYVAFSRKLEYANSVFDDPLLKKIDVIDPITNKSQNLIIKDYINTFLDNSNNEKYKKQYKRLSSNTYDFSNGKLLVIMYFPFMTNKYKYITNFTDIINSSSFFIKLLSDTSFNGLPDVNSFNEVEIKKNLDKNKNINESTKKYIIDKLKTIDKTQFRYSDDLIYLCNEGGCISEDGGENFNNLLPTLDDNDSGNNNRAISMAPFLPNKCLAQTIRYKCGVDGADKNNKSLYALIKSNEIIDFIISSLKKYIINDKCINEPNIYTEKYCKNNNADLNPNIKETPIDIINNVLSYQLRNRYTDDFNTNDKNHYSRDYSINIIKELMFLRNTYPGIQEIIFSLYIYNANNKYTIEPPWGATFLTNNQIIGYNEAINPNNPKYSINNKFYLNFDTNGEIYVKYYDTNKIFYYLNNKRISNCNSLYLSDNINIKYKHHETGNSSIYLVSKEFNLILKDEKRREPFNFYINNDGKIRVFANGFIDATSPEFMDYIDNKIVEYIKYSNLPNYNYKAFNNKNELNINKVINDDALYIDK